MTGNFSSGGLTIDFDLSEIEAGTIRMQSAVTARMQAAPLKAAQEGLSESRRTKRYVDRSGRLSGDAIALPLGKTASGADAEVFWRAEYASIVDAGSRPHVIRPRKVYGWLKFFWPKINGIFIGRRVNHPGTRGTGFAGVAYHKAERVLEREAGLAVKDAETAFDR